ncbi:hydroxyphenylacetyl-CoA thioesterase PaaI [Actinacidiphila guanduensis]|uniref:(3S)-malyl-CoA thioesterase n=1 Tax=Actinacidiphila guanduensis TaxID=310781 RepID=A0A1H0BC38_9ACTN|nr:hydroxyphenylacetyl-CoA thioesterase PaaI [Actinacidiphila guanduensis]SDN43234.1 (3S)-malyl-CoA thioesterase [Actinacidiphila guanduensis]
MVTPREAAELLWRDDTATKGLDITLLDVGPGRARLAMTVRADMVNGHGTAHGGFLAAFADSAFAVACNSYGEATVAAGFSIDFLEPAHVGEELVAEAVEVARRGRSGVYDVAILRGETVVAAFRGRSRSLGRPIAPA